jgi:hypothetical protein
LDRFEPTPGSSNRLKQYILKEMLNFGIWMSMIIMLLYSDDKIDIAHVFTLVTNPLLGTPIIVPLRSPEPDDVDAEDTYPFPSTPRAKPTRPTSRRSKTTRSASSRSPRPWTGSCSVSTRRS